MTVEHIYRKQESLKIPPHSIEAEQAVIGALIIKNEVIEIIGDIVKAEYFYNHSHVTIYKAIIDMLTECKPVDVVTLSEHLQNNGTLDEVGGFAYIAETAKNTPSTSNVEGYARIVLERYVKRLGIGAANEISEMCYSSKGLSAKEIIAKAESKVMDIAKSIGDGRKDFSIKAAVEKLICNLERIVESKKGMIGRSTGLIDLDKKINGLVPSSLNILAARPSMGKTTLMMNFVAEEIKTDGSVFIASLEMPAESLTLKLASSIGNIELKKLVNPNNTEMPITDNDWAKLGSVMRRIQDSDVTIDDRSGLSVLDIDIGVQRHIKKYGRVTSVFVDYLQIMSANKGENRTQEITEISKGLKGIAKKYEVPVIALSQLNRSLENRSDKRPINSDLRESGAIEQDADVILFIYRDEVYHPDSPNKGLAELIIGKAREAQVGMVGSVFQGQFSRFANMDMREFVQEVPKSLKGKKGLDF